MRGFLIRHWPRVYHFKLLTLLVLTSAFGCADPDPSARLREQIASELSQVRGTFAIAWKDLQTGESLLINADTLFHAASTMKTPVMIEVFRQATTGKFDLTDSVTIKNEFYSIVDSSLYSLSVTEDSDTLLYQQIGLKKSISDLVYDMIIVSSNLATNIIIDLVDARNVTQSMRNLGAENIEVLRGVEDIKAYNAGLSNRTTARDLLVIFEHLAKGDLIDSVANTRMMEILFDQRFNDIIPALLPDGIKVAHKTGSITGVHHDSGIVILPDRRRYVLVLLSKDLQDFGVGTAALARVSKHIYDFVINQDHR
ncbi:MAG: serine hydrolase [Saprospiraceae bacterium]|nr:serine hydrolase [Saprospiraceae bacterium]